MVLALNVGESAARVEQFLKSNGYSFPVLLDNRNVVSSNYNIRGIPTTFFIDINGLIIDMKVGAFKNEAEIMDSLDKIIPRSTGASHE